MYIYVYIYIYIKKCHMCIRYYVIYKKLREKKTFRALLYKHFANKPFRPVLFQFDDYIIKFASLDFKICFVRFLNIVRQNFKYFSLNLKFSIYETQFFVWGPLQFWNRVKRIRRSKKNGSNIMNKYSQKVFRQIFVFNCNFGQYKIMIKVPWLQILKGFWSVKKT